MSHLPFSQPAVRPAPPGPPRQRPPSPASRRARGLLVGGLAVLVAIAGAVGWHLTRPAPTVLEAPPLTPELKTRLLGALGWPATKPQLDTLDGPRPASEGRIEGLAAADVDGDGTPEWAVSYSWLGAPDPTGERPMQPGFAILRAGEPLEVVYRAPGVGGWSRPDEVNFSQASVATSRIDTVDLGPDGLGFMQHVAVESALGGVQVRGLARLFVPTSTGWTPAWQGTTEERQQQGPSEETRREGQVVLQDVDGDARPEILLAPSWYERHLDAEGRGPHYSVAGPGQWVYRRAGERYALAGLVPQGKGEVVELHPAPPLFALRTSRPIAVDGRFDDWADQPTIALTGLRLADPKLLKYKRRDRHGIEDSSGDVGLLYDREHLYVRATVVDNAVVPGKAGRDLYKGDHLALWIDRDLAGDFDQISRSDDDFQIGFTPGAPAMAYCWVPRAGRLNVKVASRPNVDPYSGGVYGYELEAAIPWADLGGMPGPLGADTLAAKSTGNGPAAYEWRFEAAMGLGVVLTDADDEPQELAYVSNPAFGWAQPHTFNPLILVAPK